MLGSVAGMGVAGSWRSSLLADISPNTPPSDILPIDLTNFPGLMDGSTPSIQLQLTVFDEIIMINRAPFNGQFYVLDSRCTHQGCPVNKWDADANILCPCHGSNYNIDGSLISGAAGPMQPPLNTYNFSYDGANLLQIQVPGLNLKINSLSLASATVSNKRLHLSFPVRIGCYYQVGYSTDLQTWTSPVNFALSATGTADQTAILASTSDPLEVWVDSPDPKGFFRIEVILADY
jgi:Rieske Fe-S protein